MTTNATMTAQTTTGAPIAGTLIAGAENYDIPDSLLQNRPDLVDLIINTKSMDDEERQYWFNILPIMNEEQVKKLYEILETEKQKLAEIDAKYSAQERPKVAPLDEDLIRNKMSTLQAQEARAREEESAFEDDLLRQLEEL